MKVLITCFFIVCSIVIGADYVPGYLILNMSSVQAKQVGPSLFEKHHLTHVRTLPSTKSPSLQFKQTSSTMIVQTDDDVLSVIDDLENEPQINYVEPIYTVQISTVQNDPYYYKQNYLNATALPYIWGVTDSQPTLVAVIDTGVNYLHEDLIESMYINTAEAPNGIDDDGNGVVDDIQGYNFYNYYVGLSDNDPMDVHSHGSHLSGIIAATLGNNIGIAGIAQNVSILPVRFLNSNGSGNQVDASFAIRYAADMGADVINCSWGFTKYNQVLYDAIVYATEKGSTVIAAVGNSGTSVTEYPAGFSEVIAIGSCDLEGEKSTFSSYGNHLDFLMYGESIYSTQLDDSYGFKTGSSQSTAIVSGIVAAIKSNDAGLTTEGVRLLLQQSSSLSDDVSRTSGYGLINSDRLIENLELDYIDLPAVSETTDVSLENVLPFPNPASDEMSFGMESPQSQVDITIDIYDLQGRKKRSLSETIGEGYQTVDWDLKDEFGIELRNGTYLYVITGETDTDKIIEKGKCTILR